MDKTKWYPVKVRVGEEVEITHKIQYTIKKQGFDKIIKIVAPVKKIDRLTEKPKRKYESLLPGYILVCIEEICADIVCFLENIPGVSYVLWQEEVTEQEYLTVLNHMAPEVEIELNNSSEDKLKAVKEKLIAIVNERKKILGRFPFGIIKKVGEKLGKERAHIFSNPKLHIDRILETMRLAY